MELRQPFLTYKEGKKFFICQKSDPNYVGEILTWDNINGTEISKADIHGYSLSVLFRGRLQANALLLRNGWKEEIDSTMQEMATWFLENRIQSNQKKYKKWKV